MTLTFDFDPVTGFLQPGRYSCTWNEAEAFLVSHNRFNESTTRGDLWGGLQDFLGEFVYLEQKYAHLVHGSLLDRVWLAGSFVSSKVNPRNTDVTLLFHEQSTRAVRGNEGAGILKKSRDHWLEKYNVSMVALNYRPVTSPFQAKDFTQEDRQYYLDRGRWDDWWQRTRDGSPSGEPTTDTAVPRRGYMEVSLDD